MDEQARAENSPPPSRRARAGWEYAIANPEEAAEMITAVHV